MRDLTWDEISAVHPAFPGGLRVCLEQEVVALSPLPIAEADLSALARTGELLPSRIALAVSEYYMESARRE
jgi:hypothetical protein